jgi:hypothetical protein
MCTGEMRNTFKILARKPEARRQFRRPGHRWVGNIKIVLKEIVFEVVDWSNLALDRYHFRGGGR